MVHRVHELERQVQDHPAESCAADSPWCESTMRHRAMVDEVRAIVETIRRRRLHDEDTCR